MKLIPLFYFTKTNKVRVLWCKYVDSHHYDSKWMGEKFHDIDAIADCDIVDRLETFDFIAKTNPPTMEELKKLRAKNPKWNGYSEKLVAAN